MNQETSSSLSMRKVGVAIATATALASATGWILLLLLTGNLVPRSTLVAATLAVALAAVASELREQVMYGCLSLRRRLVFSRPLIWVALPASFATLECWLQGMPSRRCS